MKHLLSVFIVMFAIGCGGGSGPDWAESPEADAPEGGEPTAGAPRAPSTPGTSAPPTSRPPSEIPSEPSEPSTPREPRDPPITPSGDRSLQLGDVWGEGLDIEVDGLRWVGEGEIQFRVGVVHGETQQPVRVDARDFSFAEDGAELGPEAWFEVERAKDLRVVMVLDTSYSIREAGALEPLRSAARTLVESLPREAQVAVVGFSTQYELLADFTDDPQDVFAAIERMQPREGRAGRFTNLWGAVEFAAQHIGAMPSDDGGRAVVVFTDGRDNVAEAEIGAAIDALGKAGVATYAVGLGEDVDVDGLTRVAGQGRFTTADNPGTLEAVFEAIASRIGEKLTVTYITPKQDGEHVLDVTIDYGGVSAGLSVLFSL